MKMNTLTARNYLVDDLMANLGQFELEEAIEELDGVIESQEQWYAELNKVLMFKLPPNTRDLSVDSHHLCALGAWLDFYGNDRIRHLPLFYKIVDNHKLLHQLASDLLTKMLQCGELDLVEYVKLYGLEKRLRRRLQELKKVLSEMVVNIDSFFFQSSFPK